MLNGRKAGRSFRALTSRELWRAGPLQIFGAVLCLWLTALVLAPGQASAQGKPTLVEVDAVIMEPLRQTQPVQGRFVARQAGPVAARTRGAVVLVHVFVGDRVTEGEPLATLDTARLAAEVQRNRAEVQHRTAQVEGATARHQQAMQELARLEGLRKSAAFSRARFDDQTSAVISAKSEIAEYQAQLEMAKADLALAEIDLAHAVVIAPFSGVVTHRYTQAGAYLGDGDPVVDLIDDQSLEIEADVPASRITSLEPGMTVNALVDGDESLKAKVRAIIPQENTLSRTRAVRFSPEFDPALIDAAAEAAVTVRVPIGAPRDVMTVNKDAIVQQGGTAVFVVEDGKAVRKPVRLGESAGSRFVVEDGLTAGMLSVVRGNERLHSGQPVTYPDMHPPVDKPAGAAEGQQPPGWRTNPRARKRMQTRESDQARHRAPDRGDRGCDPGRAVWRGRAANYSDPVDPGRSKAPDHGGNRLGRRRAGGG